MIGFYKSFRPFFSTSLHIHFNASQNISFILLRTGLVMFTNEGSITWKCLKKGNVRGYFLYICVFCSYLKYFKYCLR